MSDKFLQMTPRQIARIQKNIKAIRAQLAAERRKFGGYFDNRGLRYEVLHQCLKIADYKTGLMYIRWFHKNFPNDIGYPLFLFEQTLTHFKMGKLKEAEKLALATFYNNSYQLEYFLTGKLEDDIERMQWNDWEGVQVLDYFPYSAIDPEYADFAEWLRLIMQKPANAKRMAEFIGVLKRLMVETDSETILYLKSWIEEIRNSK